MSHSLSSYLCRGCILYAMVCGSLPYGDDTRAAQMIDRPLHFPNQPELTKGKIYHTLSQLLIQYYIHLFLFSKHYYKVYSLTEATNAYHMTVASLAFSSGIYMYHGFIHPKRYIYYNNNMIMHSKCYMLMNAIFLSSLQNANIFCLLGCSMSMLRNAGTHHIFVSATG